MTDVPNNPLDAFQLFRKFRHLLYKYVKSENVIVNFYKGKKLKCFGNYICFYIYQDSGVIRICHTAFSRAPKIFYFISLLSICTNIF